MKKYFLSIWALLIVTCILNAQQSQDDALLRYQAEKKNEIVAAALEFFIPVLGHAYAGNVEKGLVPAAVSVGGLVMVFITPHIFDIQGFYNFAWMGSLVYLGGRVWGIVSAYQTSEEYNAQLRKRLKISLVPIRSGLGVGISYSF